MTEGTAFLFAFVVGIGCGGGVVAGWRWLLRWADAASGAHR